jgi:hypothetical protein
MPEDSDKIVRAHLQRAPRRQVASFRLGSAAALTLALALFGEAACQRQQPSTHSGVTAHKALSSLTAEDRSRLCDWEAAWAGGYGKVHECTAHNSVVARESRSSCETSLRDDYASCRATVADYERCERSFWSNPCAVSKPIWERPECATVGQCMKDALRSQWVGPTP